MTRTTLKLKPKTEDESTPMVDAAVPETPPKPKEKQGKGNPGRTTVEVKSFKVAIALKAEDLPTDVVAPEGQPVKPVKLTLACDGLNLIADLNGKSYRKQLKKVEPGAFAVIQGRLVNGNKLMECGIAIQPPKQPKPVVP